MNRGLTDLVAWSHFLLAEVLEPGDAALDLTAGGGADTLFLNRQVGVAGQVFTFDIQTEALTRTSHLLQAEKARFFFCSGSAGPALVPGVFLIHQSHDQLKNIVPAPVKAVIANLGYLPGGDKNLTTEKATTLASLQQAAEILLPGGRMAVVVYTGHPGGAEEGFAVGHFFETLNGAAWRILKLEPCQRKTPPLLWIAEKSNHNPK
jgi:predicted methyltransferase